MIPNAPKHETHQNMSLGCNGVDQLHPNYNVTSWHELMY